MNRAKPPLTWAGVVSKAMCSACKIMRPMHAWLFTNRPARKRALKGQKADIKKLLFLAAAVVSGECGRMSRSDRTSGVLSPAPAWLQEAVRAAAER